MSYEVYNNPSRDIDCHIALLLLAAWISSAIFHWNAGISKTLCMARAALMAIQGPLLERRQPPCQKIARQLEANGTTRHVVIYLALVATYFLLLLGHFWILLGISCLATFCKPPQLLRISVFFSVLLTERNWICCLRIATCSRQGARRMWAGMPREGFQGHKAEKPLGKEDLQVPNGPAFSFTWVFLQSCSSHTNSALQESARLWLQQPMAPVAMTLTFVGSAFPRHS